MAAKETKAFRHDDSEKDGRNWHTWQGKKSRRHLCNVIEKRSCSNVFVNCSNATTNSPFGCNDNITCGVSGGRPMHVTNCVFKPTVEEDNEMFRKATRAMVKKTTKEMEAMKEDDEEAAEMEMERLGMKSLIGSAFLACKHHASSATMAAHLVPKDSRFGFSHTFNFLNLKDFHKDGICDVDLDKMDGNLVIKTNAQNCLFRPLQLEEMCLCDFVKKHAVCQKNQESMNFLEENFAHTHLGVNRAKLEKVPVIDYKWFPNAENFKENDTMTSAKLTPMPLWQHKMNKCAKLMMTLFVPFRGTKELSDGQDWHLTNFQEAIRNKMIQEEHISIMKNTQDCHNCVNSGRAPDPLSALAKEWKSDKEKEDDDGLNEEGEDVNYHKLLDKTMKNPPFASMRSASDFDFCEDDNRFKMRSSIIRKSGTHCCGYKLLKHAKILPGQCAIKEHNRNGVDVEGELNIERLISEDVFKDLTCDNLHELIITWVKRKTLSVVKEDLERCGATGEITNIALWADEIAKDNKDQKQAFILIVSAFALQVHKRAKDKELIGCCRKRLKVNENEKCPLDLFKEERGQMFFLTGSGRSGKSRVIKSVMCHCESFYKNLNLPFDRQTIVVTALTGAAAVEINGETTHVACGLRKKTGVTGEMIAQWANAPLVIVDEVLFSSESNWKKLVKNLGDLKQSGSALFGGLAVVLAGDFSQLAPVNRKSLHVTNSSKELDNAINAFLELKTQHRFSQDPLQNELMMNMRLNGPAAKEVKIVNSRVIDLEGGPKESDIPNDACCAVKNDVDRAAVNDGVFMDVTRETHCKDKRRDPPLNAVCLKASNLTIGTKVEGKSKLQCRGMTGKMKDLFFAACGEGHVRYHETKCTSPLLKLYHDQPIVLVENESVEEGMANRTMGKFKELKPQPGVSMNDLKVIKIDKCYIRCANVSQVQCLVMQIDDSNKVVEIKPKDMNGKAGAPVSLDGTLNRYTRRVWKRIQMKQIPINIENARTVHKLQGKTLKYLVVSLWNCLGNWVYVVLSRVKTLNGLFLQKPLQHKKTRGMDDECKSFLSYH